MERRHEYHPAIVFAAQVPASARPRVDRNPWRLRVQRYDHECVRLGLLRLWLLRPLVLASLLVPAALLGPTGLPAAGLPPAPADTPHCTAQDPEPRHTAGGPCRATGDATCRDALTGCSTGNPTGNPADDATGHGRTPAGHVEASTKAHATDEAPLTMHDADRGHDRPRVVLADDHCIVTEGLARLLRSEFELCGIVNNGRALVEAVGELQPDVVVADIGMPELNGLEALAQLKARDPAVRVVFLTMHQNPMYVQHALAAGAMGYVIKHSAAEELVLAVHAALAGSTFISPSVSGDQDVQGDNDIAHTSTPQTQLTRRQREILSLVADGLSAKQVAQQLNISSRTVEYHKYAIMRLLGVDNTASLIRFALETQLAEA